MLNAHFMLRSRRLPLVALLLALTVALTVALVPLPARAVPLNFSITGDTTASFSLESSPTPPFDNGLTFYFYDVPGHYGGEAVVFDKVGFAVAPYGGFVLYAPDTTLFSPSGYFINALNGGEQLFTGTLAQPTFKTGAFDYTAYYLQADGMLAEGKIRLDIAPFAVSTVPEPQAWVMAGSGLLALYALYGLYGLYGPAPGPRARWSRRPIHQNR